MTVPFNLEEFVDLNVIEEKSDTCVPIEPTWESYPNLWAQADAIADPVAIINFDGATLIDEAYEDPFEGLSTESTDDKADFKRKLTIRRAKLEDMARNLKCHTEWPLADSCASSSSWITIRQVQAYSLHVSNSYLSKSIELYVERYTPSIYELIRRSELLLTEYDDASESEKTMAGAMLHMFMKEMPKFLK